MLAVQLERSWDGLDRCRLPPIDGLRIDGISLRILPLNTEILRLVGDQWRTDNESFAGLVVETPILVYAERSRRSKGRFYGPFDFVRVSHTSIYSSINERRTFARFNPIDCDWHLCPDQSNWPRIILLPCGNTLF
jgi:hypothetical protein